MIIEYSKNNSSQILDVVNDAALKYKGIIPDNCWQDPYMSVEELYDEFNKGVHMFGYRISEKLVGVMGIQEVKDVTLIRHAYTLTQYQGTGVGKSLLRYLLKRNHSTCLLVGTWKEATWAIQFYEKFDFVIQTKKQTTFLLDKYWKISSNQIENSVVLKR